MDEKIFIILRSICLFISTYIYGLSTQNFSSIWQVILEMKLAYFCQSYADNLCKQFGPRSGQTKCLAWSESKLFDTLMVFLKELFEKVGFEINNR